MHGPRGVAAPVVRHVQLGDHRGEQVLLGRIGIASKKRLAVDDLHRALAAGSVGQVHVITEHGGFVDAGIAHGRLGGAGLRPDHAEVPDEDRVGGIAEVEDLEPAIGGPSVGLQIGDEIGDAGVALPPVLVRPIEARGDVDDENGIGGVGDVIDLMAEVAVGAQQVVLARLAPRQLVAAADLHHLRPAIFRICRIALCGQVVEQEGAAWGRDVDDGIAVRFHGAAQRIEREAIVMPDIGDPPAVLLLEGAADTRCAPGGRDVPRASCRGLLPHAGQQQYRHRT